MQEAFSSFFKKKNPNSPSSKKTGPTDHDEYTDAVMHHLNSLHKLTHPKSDWSSMHREGSRSHKHISDLHTSINAEIDKIGGRKRKTF